MGRDLNKWTGIGRLTRDAEFKMTPSGKELLSFGIASNDDWGDKKKVNYFDVTLWGKAAAALQSYMVKGKQVAVEGSLTQERWEKDGQKHQRIKINAQNVQLLGGGDKQEGSAPSNDGPPDQEPTGPDTGDPSIPF